MPLPGEMTVERIIEHLTLDGYCIIPEVIPYDEVGAIHDSLAETALAQGRLHGLDVKIAQQPPPHPLAGDPSTYGYGPTYGLLSLNQSFAPYLADDRIVGTLKAFWGPYVRITWIKGELTTPGFQRSGWHADQPFNQKGTLRVFAPYGDAVIHLSSVWMLSDFTEENGGTLVVPGSHRANNNPTGGNGIDVMSPYPTEKQAIGKAGDVLLFDSRTWHAAGANTTNQPRLAIAVRYAPWWFNLDYLMPPDSPEKQRLAEEIGRPVEEFSGGEPTLTPDSFEALPAQVKPLLRHWVR